MSERVFAKFAFGFAFLALLIAGTAFVIKAQTAIPRPVLVFKGKEETNLGSKEAFLYRLDVENKADFPKELFAAAPDLPPCGKNANSARSWVDIYSQKGGRIYGFCGLKSPAELDKLIFIVPKETPLDYVYIIIRDRKTDREYKSTLVSTQTQ